MADARTGNVELATSIATAWIANPHSRAADSHYPRLTR